MKPGIVRVKGGGKGEGYRLFNEFRPFKNNKGFERILVVIGKREYEARPGDIRRYPDADRQM
jgi:hypothetical protein